MKWFWRIAGLLVAGAVAYGLYRRLKTKEPTVEELITKALEAEVIDQEFAEELRDSADLEEALGMFYTYVIEEGGDPEELLREWNITADRQK